MKNSSHYNEYLAQFLRYSISDTVLFGYVIGVIEVLAEDGKSEQILDAIAAFEDIKKSQV